MAEALALKKGMQMALDLDLKNVMFETDCEVLMKAVAKAESLADWKSEAVVEDTCFLKLLFSSF